MSPEVIPDDRLGYLILSWLSGVVRLDAFPIKVREIQENLGADGDVQSFTIVTFSGLRYTVHVTYVGKDPA